MQERRSLVVPSLLGAVLFFSVGLWWDLHGFRNDYRRSTDLMPDRLTTLVDGVPVHTERTTGESDQTLVERHIQRVLRVTGEGD